ncbi:hypothetical protein G0U57_011290 [Chelydra serpentina]|uniref:Uncharacterized protein n=1 Tax=Chelydra serpentina TaxID=8475 RepID=A0A8T1T692_CHESE|nr:hypothetical protein G0U57_011290 [Chelydra serpentina]
MPEMTQPSNVLTPPPTASASMDGNVVAIIIAATVSSSVFVVAILVLLLLLYHRDPLCCQFLCSCRFFQSPSQYDCPPPYFSSNQRLVGPQSGAQQLESPAENPGVQGDELFCVGSPSSYQLPPWEQLRLPSYESVRKKDRQREIHQLIAERFGLWVDPSQEVSGKLLQVPKSCLPLSSSTAMVPSCLPVGPSPRTLQCSSGGLCSLSLQLPFSDSISLWKRHTRVPGNSL